MSDAPRIPSLLRSCVTKVGHKTFAKAESARASCMAKRPERKLRAYHCTYCDRWHLTGEPTMVEKVEREQGSAVIAPPPEPKSFMVDLRCGYCRNQVGARITTATTTVACRHCSRQIPCGEAVRALANARACQEQSEDAYRLRVLRSERCLQTADIAEAVGINREFLRGWLDGAHPLAQAQLDRVRDFMEGL